MSDNQGTDDAVHPSDNLLLSRLKKHSNTDGDHSLFPWVISRHIKKIHDRNVDDWDYFGDRDVVKLFVVGAVLF